MNKQAFTLVELIVVVTILAILATIGFVSYSGYLTGVRDTNRIASLTAISDGLELYRTRNDLPDPDDAVDIQVEGIDIAHQGYVGSNVLQTIEYSKAGKDPKDDSYYSYYLTDDKKHYQLMAFLEESDNLDTNIISQSNAATSYENRYPKVYGKKLGILTDPDNTPVQEIITGVLNFTGGTSSEYIARFSDTQSLTGSGNTLKSIAANASCKRIKEIKGGSRIGIYSINPTGNNAFDVYCDMTRDGGGWTLVGKTVGNFPPQNFLDAALGTVPDSLESQEIVVYSIDASDISFGEVIMGISEDSSKYFGILTPDIFDNNRAFETVQNGTETCVTNLAYYSDNTGATKYWWEYSTFGETLISNRRNNTAGGIDLGGTYGEVLNPGTLPCRNSRDTFAMYRGSDSHQSYLGNVSTMASGIYTFTYSTNYLGYNTNTSERSPNMQSMDTSKMLPAGNDKHVWLMVK